MKQRLTLADKTIILLEAGDMVCGEYADLYIVYFGYETQIEFDNASRWLAECMIHRLVPGKNMIVVVYQSGTMKAYTLPLKEPL